MSNEPRFHVKVLEWRESPSNEIGSDEMVRVGIRRALITCIACQQPRTVTNQGPDSFTEMLGAIEVHCPNCEAHEIVPTAPLLARTSQ